MTLHFFHGSKPNSFLSQKDKIHCTKIKEDHDYGSSLLCVLDHQTN